MAARAVSTSEVQACLAGSTFTAYQENGQYDEHGQGQVQTRTGLPATSRPKTDG